MSNAFRRAGRPPAGAAGARRRSGLPGQFAPRPRPAAGLYAELRGFPAFENTQANAAIVLVEATGRGLCRNREGLHRRGAQGARHDGAVAPGRRASRTAADSSWRDPTEAGGAKRHDTVMVATLSGVTAIVSAQIIEAARATLTDDVAAYGAADSRGASEDAADDEKLRRAALQDRRSRGLPHRALGAERCRDPDRRTER